MVPEMPVSHWNLVNHISERRGFLAMTVLLAVMCHVEVMEFPWYEMLRICRRCTWNPSSPNSPATVSKSLRRNRRVSQRSSSAKQVRRWGLEFSDTGSKEG